MFQFSSFYYIYRLVYNDNRHASWLKCRCLFDIIKRIHDSNRVFQVVKLHNLIHFTSVLLYIEFENFMSPFLTGSSNNDANVALLVAEHPRVNDPNLSITCIYYISH